MNIEQGWDEIQHDPLSIITVGSFDGVHRGHQAIIHFLEARTAEMGGHSTLVTFDQHPRTVLTGKSVEMLNSLDEKIERLAALGLDRVVVLPFTHDLANISAFDYLQQILVDKIGVKEMVIGYDHHFGKNREGNLAFLQKFEAQFGFSIHLIPVQMIEDEVISSTQIRESLKSGDLETAHKLLGYRFQLRGKVVHGAKRGRTIGFPTANIALNDSHKLIPKLGVYAIQAALPDGTKHNGMMNIGKRPTIEDEGNISIEAHLFEFDGDLYDTNLKLELIAYIRPEQKFNSIEFLRNQLQKDAADCKKMLKDLS